ncbi:flagellar motor protein MotB [Rhodosalinus sp. 5P4]|uniref:flagellar motor protein MotB n=1 Tax=Rhodosalinus sp. 5P4 TaxID=3239196 RepID=UPI0035253351
MRNPARATAFPGVRKVVSMASGSNVAPVIVKRKKVVRSDGHHGGAWKVAYADFVTAMMAFFMLMWLLNATTEKQRKGLADYFDPTIPIVRQSGGGSGPLGGESVFAEEIVPRIGTGAASRAPTEENRARGDRVPGTAGPKESGDATAEAEALARLDAALRGNSGESHADDLLRQHVVTRVTDEGLVVEIFARPGAPLFEGDAAPTPLLEALAGVIGRLSGMVTNQAAVEAHVRASPIVMARNPAWDLSARRAAALRTLLEEGGLAPARVRRVTGHADRAPALPEQPMSVRNDRLEIVFLRTGRVRSGAF